jgi:hypothetical protein
MNSAPVDRDTGLICDQTVALNGFYAAKHYPAYLRRIRYRDPETGKNLVFLTNQFALPALTICALYRCRWQVELFTAAAKLGRTPAAGTQPPNTSIRQREASSCPRHLSTARRSTS